MSIEMLESDNVDIESVFGSAVERCELPELITSEATYTGNIQRHAQYIYLSRHIPDSVEPNLEETSFYGPDNFVFPFWSHISVVEDDPESDGIVFKNYVAGDDMGPQINPKSIEGLVHGKDAKGSDQTLYEGAVYDNGYVTSEEGDYNVS